MLYSDLYLKKKFKAPVFFILLSLIVISYFAFLFITKISLPSKASNKTLRRLEIVNLTDKQAGIFWQTDNKEMSWVIFGEAPDKIDQVSYDERDVEENKSSFINHYTLLRGLKKNTPYYFKVISNNQTISDLKGRPFVVQTTDTFLSLPGAKPAYGKIFMANGNPQENAVVFLTVPNSYPLLTLTKPTGEWLIPLSGILDRKTKKIQTITSDENLNIEVINEDKMKTTITANSDTVSPLPQTVILGKDYTFAGETNVLSAATSSQNEIEGKSNIIEIIFPKENAVIPNPSPLIKGLAIPGNDVLIYISSKPSYSARVKTDQDGFWRLSVPIKIPPGQYTLTVNTKDKTDNEINLSRKFNITFDQNGQVLSESTPEASPTVLPQPTYQPSPTYTSYISPTITPPVTGFNSTLVAISSGALIILGIGLLLAF